MTYCSDVIFLSLNYSPGAFLAYYSFVLLVFGVYHKERLMGTDISKVKRSFSAQAWKPGSQHAGEKRGVAGLLLGRTERAARAAELQICAQAR